MVVEGKGKGGFTPPVEKRWKPGQSGNPSGRPKLPEALRKIPEMHGDEVKRKIAGCLRMNKEQLQALLNNPDADAFALAVASILARGIKDADPSRIEYLLNRAGCFLDKPAVQAPQKGSDDDDGSKAITHEQIMLYIEGKRT